MSCRTILNISSKSIDNLYMAGCRLCSQHGDPNQHQNLIICSFYHPGTLHIISLQSVDSVLGNVSRRHDIRTESQKDRETNKCNQKRNLLCQGGNHLSADSSDKCSLHRLLTFIFHTSTCLATVYNIQQKGSFFVDFSFHKYSYAYSDAPKNVQFRIKCKDKVSVHVSTSRYTFKTTVIHTCILLIFWF